MVHDTTSSCNKYSFGRYSEFHAGGYSAIPDLGVSTAILNAVENFHRWCKLNFGLLGGHVELRHFTISLPFY